MIRLSILLLLSACNPFARDAPPPVPVTMTPVGAQPFPTVQVPVPGQVPTAGGKPPAGGQGLSVTVSPQGVQIPGLGVQVGPSGVSVPGINVQIQPPTGVPLPGAAPAAGLPASFGVAECDEYARISCTCSNAIVRATLCSAAHQAFAQWAQIASMPQARVGLTQGCAQAAMSIRSTCP